MIVEKVSCEWLILIVPDMNFSNVPSEQACPENCARGRASSLDEPQGECFEEVWCQPLQETQFFFLPLINKTQ